MRFVQPIVSRSPSTRANPLVIAKPTCIEPEDYSKLANCKPSNPHGIVQPRWNLPPLEAKDTGRWNKEQYAPPYAQGPGNADVRQQPRSESSKSSSEHKDKFSPMKDSNNEEQGVPPFELWDKAPHDDTRFVSPVNVHESNSHSTGGYEEIPTESISPLQTFNLWIIFSIMGVVLPSFAILVYIIFRCRRRNEGSYNVEENHTFIEQRAPSMRKFADDNDVDASVSAPASAASTSTCLGDRYQRSKVKVLLTSPSSPEAYELRTAVVADGSEVSTIQKSDLGHSSPPASSRAPTRGQPQSPNKEWYV